MFKTHRKRAVVLALIAFFCTAAATYVAVDWKRFGGGFLAFLRGKHESVVASGGGSSSGSGVGHRADGVVTHSNSPALPQLVATARPHKAGAGGGGGGGKSEEDLFKYGDPAAGGIPPGSFVVAQNEPQGGGNGNGGGAPAPGPGAPESTPSAPGGAEGGGGGGGATTSPAPAPSNGNPGDSGLPISGGTTGGKTPTPPASPTPPATSPPPTKPVTPAPPPPTDPIQSGTSDTPTPPTDNAPPPSISTPVSAVPEASNAAMMTLGALFFAAAAIARKRNNG